jgi:hypothetical protein
MQAVGSWLVKLQRAREHRAAFQSELSWWEHARPWKVSITSDETAGEYVARVERVDEISLKWSAIIGDCLQTYRSALDHIVNRIALDHRGATDDRTEFPVFSDAAKFAGARRKITLLPPEAQAAIELLQPYHRGEAAAHDPLWHLHELSRIDKHRSLHLVLLRAAPVLYFRGTERPLIWYLPPGFLERDTEIARFTLESVPWLARLTEQDEVRLWLNVGVAFRDAPAEGLTVTSVLDQIGDAVTHAVERLSRFVGST